MNPDTTAGFGIAMLGLSLGMRHATDPDHVIAVTTILSRERRLISATRVGIVWGLGHTLTVLTVGAAIIIFKLAVPTRVVLAMEFGVAIVLILLGVGAAARVAQQINARIRTRPSARHGLIVHAHSHAHELASHSLPHVHRQSHDLPDETKTDMSTLHHDHILATEQPPSFAAHRPMMRSFGVGIVHGLAGSAAIALLVLSAIPDPIWATLYLAIFCVGTILGMGLITTAIATPFIVASRKVRGLHQGFVTGSGLLSFGFGLFLVYKIGIVHGLFGTVPIWTPH